jgi:hypothetical protein
VLLSHDDRSRFAFAGEQEPLRRAWTVGWGSVLHDGFVRARWRQIGDEIVVRHVSLPHRPLRDVVEEARRPAGFLGAAGAVRVERVGAP